MARLPLSECFTVWAFLRAKSLIYWFGVKLASFFKAVGIGDPADAFPFTGTINRG